MNECLFCKIAAGDIPSAKVFEDDRCFAFLDIRPINPGHALIIPQEHAANLAELTPEIGGYLFQMGQRIAGALLASALPCDGVNFFLADGKVAGQEVKHVHLHVIPRFEGDGFGLKFGPEYERPTPKEEIAAAADQVRKLL